MSLPRPLSSALITLTTLAVACGGAAAPTATPTKAPVATATTAPAPARPTATQPPAAAVGTPTPTLASAEPAKAPAGSKGKMTMAAVADVTNLDVHVATAGGLSYFYTASDVNAFLVLDQRPGAPTEPYLAESWQWLDPGNIVRYVIRKGARFHDGKPVTAQDVACSIEKMKSAYATKGTNSNLPRWIKSYEAVDERTINITMTETNAVGWSTLGTLVTQPCHQPYELMQKNPIGAGPYKVAQWRPFELIEITDAGYFWEPVQVKTIVRLTVPEPESRLAMLKSGQIDFMDEVQPRQAEELRKDQRFNVKVTQAGTYPALVFSTDTPVVPGTDVPNPFLDVRVRRAFIMALDRKAIFEGVVLGKYGSYIPGPWPRFGKSGEDKITPYPYDPKAARKLLEDAKFPFDREWPIWVYRTTAGFAEAAEVAVAQWNAIGVKARFRLTEVGTLLSYWQDRPAKTYPMSFIRGTATAEGQSTSWWADNREPEGYITPVNDDKIRDIVRRLRLAFDPTQRDKLFEEAYIYIHEQAIQIPLVGGGLIHAFNQRVDYTPVPGQVVTLLWRTKWLPGAP